MTRFIALAADHAGFPLKTEMVSWLQIQGHQVLDLGASSFDSGDDYPDYEEAVAVRWCRARHDAAF